MSTFKVGHMRIHLQYCWKKTGSPNLYYRRRVPLELQPVLGKKIIVESLRTSDLKKAEAAIKKIAAMHDRMWEKMGKPTKVSLLEQAEAFLQANGVVHQAPDEGPLFALHDHLETLEVNGKLPEPQATAVQLLKGTFPYSLTLVRDQYTAARPEDTERCERAFKYLLEFLRGDPDIRSLRRFDVNNFVTFLLDKDMSTTTVQRYIAPLKASFARCIRENELDCVNVFAKVEIPKFGQDVQDREVFTPAERKALLNAIDRHGQDTLRSILLVIAETGARLSEVLGLAKGDIVESPIPHIQLKPHPWRSLKTPGSTRKIPLSDRALRSLCDARDRSEDPVAVYPQYCDTSGSCNATAASAALVKWIRTREGLKGTKLGVHSLRHAMKDLLRSVKCPMEAADQIVGHATPGMGANYGEGYPIEMLYEYVVAATK
jgi:integrase